MALLEEETEVRKRLAKALLAEILVPIKVSGPCGEVKAWGLIDTGATANMLMPDVLERTCLWDEEEGMIYVASGDSFKTRKGRVKMQVGEGDCPELDTEVFEGPFNLVGMDYMDPADMVIEAKSGKVACRVRK